MAPDRLLSIKHELSESEKCWNMVSMYPKQITWQPLGCYFNNLSMYMSLSCRIWVPKDRDISAFACCCQVKRGPSKWATMVGGSGQVTRGGDGSCLIFIHQVTLKRPASSPVRQTASSASGPTGHAAVSPVGVAWRFGQNGCVKNHIMEEGLAPNWTMLTRYFLPLILILRILTYCLDSLWSIFFSKMEKSK